MSQSSCTEMQKKKIISILPANVELGAIASGKLYTSNAEGKIWLFTDLEGILCFLLDHQNKTTYLSLYDNYSFEKLFQYELYKDFTKFFVNLAPDFRCFEVERGFIGIQFDLETEANLFDVVVKKFSGKLLENIFTANVTTRKADDASLTKKVASFCTILKQNWSLGSEGKYDENYIEQGLEIVKARNFEVLNNISFDRANKKFQVGEISAELKSIFVSSGIRKRDLKDVDFAFNCFKNIIMGVSGDNNRKTKQIENIPHVFYPPEMVEKMDKEDENEVQEPTPQPEQNQPQQVVKKKTVTKQVKKAQAKTGNSQKAASKQPKAKKPALQKAQPKARTADVSSSSTPTPSSVPKVPAVPSVPSVSSIPSVPPVPIPSVPLSASTTSSSNIPSVPPVPSVPTAPSVPNVPSIPNVPVPPPISFSVISNSTSTNQTSETPMSREEELQSIKLKAVKVEENEKPKELSMYEQIKNVKLVKVEKEPTPAPKIITKNERTFLQNALSTAIKLRKMNLNKHEEDSDDSDDSDW